jgi:ligand-binding sensor domain-containing protein
VISGLYAVYVLITILVNDVEQILWVGATAGIIYFPHLDSASVVLLHRGSAMTLNFG